MHQRINSQISSWTKSMGLKLKPVKCRSLSIVSGNSVQTWWTTNLYPCGGGGEIEQWLVSLSVKLAVQVRARHDPFVSERWNSITVLLNCSHQCWRLVQQRPSMCYHLYVIMIVKDSQFSVVRVGHCVLLAGFCLSLYDLHVLNRDVNMIQTNKQKIKKTTIQYSFKVGLLPM